ncbi:hypothetical protein [Novosphingobium sp.]|uniref:hypothetical protein n=1 Tax=Novosphingobium sp. TaxID=1874826 RepID=UPI002735EB1F|nr:hypothetical protein [Novosphingobium sp.]MDP3907320.1 hypothetical protein [Novosphingobium sp.]
MALTGMAAGLSLLLSACLISPGKFASTIDLRKDGTFAYGYQGEIHMLGLSKLAEMGSKAKGDAEFTAVPCYKDDGDFEERKCTKEEVAQQKADWEEEQKSAVERDKKNAEMMRAMLGGIDPTNPQAAEELADRLRRQAGWKTVTYKGNGVFVVDFQLSGRIDHDFIFPTIERFPAANPFVILNRRADGAVRVEAPGFGPSASGGGMSNFAQLMAMGAAADEKKEGEEAPELPQLEGTLTLTTNGAILANNTDEGPVATTTGQKLEWKITPRSTTAPTALVKLGG